MTATAREPGTPSAAAPHAGPGGGSPAEDVVHRVCPFVTSVDGRWRGTQPTRDHRCGATQPPAALAIPKQRELCLVSAHRACATYAAARDLERDSGRPAGRGEDDGFWPTTRGTVVALEPAGSRMRRLPGAGGRAGGQAMLVGLMVVAFLVLIVARTSPPSTDAGPATPDPAAVGASGLPGPTASSPASSGPKVSATPAATLRPTPDASPSSGATPGAGAAASAGPSASVAPSGATRYRVKSGDTLSAIARRYNVTVKQLKAANGLTDNVIRVGQVMVIP